MLGEKPDADHQQGEAAGDYDQVFNDFTHAIHYPNRHNMIPNE